MWLLFTSPLIRRCRLVFLGCLLSFGGLACSSKRPYIPYGISVLLQLPTQTSYADSIRERVEQLRRDADALIMRFHHLDEQSRLQEVRVAAIVERLKRLGIEY